MKRLFLAASCLVALALPASADVIFLGQQDLSGLGFGNFPRMLTLQTSPLESGSVTPVDQVHGDAISGANKSSTPTIATLGWLFGNQVLVAADYDTSSTGITQGDLTINIFDGTTLVASFSQGPSLTFSDAQVSAEQGNGNGVFVFGLDATQQIAFNTLAATPGFTGFFVGLSATAGCGAGAPVGCIAANDGPDTWVGIQSAQAVPGPIVGAGLPGLIAACAGLWGFNRSRRRRVA